LRVIRFGKALEKRTVQPPSSSEGELVKIVDIGWRLAPNPTTEEITIHYQFAEKMKWGS
jgi:hypothetical protein